MYGTTVIEHLQRFIELVIMCVDIRTSNAVTDEKAV